MAGEFTSAQHYLDQGFALYRPQEHDSFIISYGLDLRVGYLGHQGFTLWSLGYPDQAVHKIEEALWVAHESAHPHSLIMTLTFAASISLMRGQTDAAREHVETLLALAQTHEFPYFVSQGTVLHGQVLVALGHRKEGIRIILAGITAHRAEGASLGLIAGLTSLAGAYGQEGQIDQGMRVVEEAFAAVSKSGEYMYDTTLYTLKGRLLLKKAENQCPQTNAWQGKAEECFQKALELARSQEAKSFELQATISLSRLWYKQGKNEQARQLLEEIYSWFTEGFETRDLRNAKALLNEWTVERM